MVYPFVISIGITMVVVLQQYKDLQKSKKELEEVKKEIKNHILYNRKIHQHLEMKIDSLSNLKSE